MGVFELLLLV